jgi:DNA-binding CsgD family transcriptional regulator
LLSSVASLSCCIDDRRRTLVAGISDLVGADVWIWIHTRSNSAEMRPSGFHILDGGWRDDAERSAFLGAMYDPQLSRAVNSTLLRSEHTTATREQFLPEDDPDRAPVLDWWTRSTGMRECIASVFPIMPEVYSAVGLHRRVGKPPFTSIQRDMVHLILSKVDWLHKDGHDVPANDERLLKLSPREREVLLYLLEGDSRKQIAQRLGLSHHTIADHMKAIYKHFDVNSRAELLALFMRSGVPTFLPAQ